MLKFTADEDEFLKKGIDKHGLGKWIVVLRHLDFSFQRGRLAPNGTIPD